MEFRSKKFGYADFYSNLAFGGTFIQRNWDLWVLNTFSAIFYNLHFVWPNCYLLYMVVLVKRPFALKSVFLAKMYKFENSFEFLAPKTPFRCNFWRTRTFLSKSGGHAADIPSILAESGGGSRHSEHFGQIGRARSRHPKRFGGCGPPRVAPDRTVAAPQSPRPGLPKKEEFQRCPSSLKFQRLYVYDVTSAP